MQRRADHSSRYARPGSSGNAAVPGVAEKSVWPVDVKYAWVWSGRSKQSRSSPPSIWPAAQGDDKLTVTVRPSGN
jgi:hypothetical protein